MEVHVGPFQMAKLGVKLVKHKIQQNFLATNETVMRNTTLGLICGIKRRTIYDEFFYAFEGIPYARPPLGELRFRAPQPAIPWQGMRDCRNVANKPLQKHFVMGITEGSEDCLYLNVYTKKLSSPKPLPVMVWIYGGGFQIGEASRELYAPDYFMNEDVVLVCISYRLGALGFLSLADPDIDVPGNSGLKDQLMALQWVKENIDNFNGDPNNITVFGESAGGASTHTLMLTEKAKGLFHKAIVQSGTALCAWATLPHYNWGYRLAVACGYKGANNDKEVFRYLHAVDAKKIVAAQSSLLTEQEKREYLLIAFGPVVEPYITSHCIVPKPLKEMLPNAWSNEIPVILGGTSFEGLFSYLSAHLDKYLINNLGDCEEVVPLEIQKLHTKEEIREMGLKLKKEYFNDQEPNLNHTLMPYLDLLSYKHFWHAIHRAVLARLHYAPQAATYLYRFDFDSTFFNHYRLLKCGSNVRGVSHADDLSYLFYNISASALPKHAPEYRTIERMIGMWVAFATSANPNCMLIKPAIWEPVVRTDSKQWKCLNINEDVEFIDLPETKRLALWDSFYTKETLY